MSKEEILMKQKDAWLYIDEHSIDGSIGGAYDAMDEYAKETVFDFLKFREKYQREERDKVIIEQVRVGGVFTWIGASDEKIYEEYLKSKTNNNERT
jgi:hypothetical protein